MAALTSYLQEEFSRLCPPGWISRREVHIVPADLENLLGYAPRADVVLERQDLSTRLWIEFEISRADPVANHVKFATSHLFKEQRPEDVFIAMLSPHVALGRRNLAANTIHLMRHIGMSAFQTVLFPQIPAEEVKRLNHLRKSEISRQNLCVEAEIERALFICEPVIKPAKQGEQSIYFAGDVPDAMLNLHNWNHGITTKRGQQSWGKRTVTYFVYQPRTRTFAPSKFCAYVGIESCSYIAGAEKVLLPRSGMTIELYATLDQKDARFDGGRAKTHLTDNLGMLLKSPDEEAVVSSHFERWIRDHHDFINVHPRGPYFIIPPLWFR